MLALHSTPVSPFTYAQPPESSSSLVRQESKTEPKTEALTESDMEISAFFGKGDNISVSEQDTSRFDMFCKQYIDITGSGAVDNKMPPPSEDDLGRLAETGEFDVRSPIGQVFGRAHAKGTPGHKEYQLCVSREEKRKFRENWAKEKYKDHVVKKNKEESFDTVDTTKGEYLTFGAIVVALGGWGWQPAIDGAKKLCMKCCRLGGQWVDHDDFTEMPMFLKLSKQHTDIFRRKWSQYEEWSLRLDEVAPQVCTCITLHGRPDPAKRRLDAPAPPNRLAAPTPPNDDWTQNTRQQTPGRPSPAKPLGRPDPAKKRLDAPTPPQILFARAQVAAEKLPLNAPEKAEEQPAKKVRISAKKAEPTAEKDPEKTALQEALALRGHLNKSVSAAQNLVKRIQSGEAYEWANNQQNVGRLKEAIAKCDSNMRGFNHDFLVVESKTLMARDGLHVQLL